MNYSNELQLVNSEILQLTTQLAKLQKEQSILTQLIEMGDKMKALREQLAGSPVSIPEQEEQPSQTIEVPVLSIVREETPTVSITGNLPEKEEVQVQEEEEEEGLTITEEVVSNKLCALGIDIDGKSISGSDFTDQYNLPRCYNQTWRSYKRAWKALMNQFTEKTTMFEACTILRDNGVRMRSYCSMD
jgi:hypothetical protein